MMDLDAKVKILFVDDEPDVIQPLAMETEEKGYEPIMASNGSEGWTLLEEHHETIALVFADYHMGDINGLEFRQKMMEKYQHIPFIIYSGFVNKEMLRNAIDLKVARFIDKPFDVYRISDVIKEEAKSRIETVEEKLTLRKIFIEEAMDLLEDLESEILALEGSPTSEQVNNIFRLVHTIKGGSGVLEWPEFTRAVHAYEDLLSKCKSGSTDISKKVVSVLLSGFDFVTRVIADYGEGKKTDIDVAYWTKVFDVDSDDSVDDGTVTQLNAGQKKQDEDVIKVPTAILDDFMELSGEITVIRNTVNKLVSNLQKEVSGNSDLYLLAEFLEEMHKINSSMQNKITEMRKVSLRNIYRTFPRTVRDLNLSLGKQIDLKITGDELRVDTKLAQVLKNSLIHIIRNSADHGIESEDVRLERNKNARGLIELRSFEHGDDVIVEIEDNGGGIDSEFIANRAVEKSLYTQDAINSMSERQIFKIIMEPGFSTAAQVTDISGRGVGMDMVKSSIESIGGKIDIDSKLLTGSKFTLKLPIPKSVTIIQSLLVKIGSRVFNIPQDNIIRLIKVEGEKKSEMIQNAQGSDFLRLDERLIQLVDLVPYLSPGSEILSASQREQVNIVLVRSENIKFGIIVDEISDTEEIVVKKIPNQIKEKLFKGATFMGDGSVGLILDIEGTADFCKLSEKDVEVKEVVNETEGQESEEYILFTLPRKGYFAFKLAHIYRLEELPTKNFTRVSGQLSTIYRDTVIPLKFVHESLGRNSGHDLMERATQSTIIVRDGEHYLGLIIDTIKEIKKIDGPIDESVSDRAEILGNVILQDQVISVLDLYKIANILPPEKKEHRTSDLGPAKHNKNKKEETIGTESLAANGWGLF